MEIVPKSSTKGLIDTDPSIRLATNYYQINFDTSQNIYTYQIETNPKLQLDAETSLQAYKVFSKAARNTLKEKLAGIYMESNRTIYSPRSTNGDFLCNDKAEYEGVSYEITVLYKGAISLKQQTAETKQILGRLFKRIIYKKLDLKPIGRKHFDPHQERSVEGNQDLSMMMGFGTSLNTFGERLLFNIDICYRAIQQQEDVLTYLKHLDCNKDQVSQEIEGTTVLTRYCGKQQSMNYRFYRVAGVDFSMNPSSTFKLKDQEVTYQEYYYQKYNIKIRDSHQPMLKVVQKKGKIEQTIYLIPELCQLTGLNDQMRQNNNLMRSVAKITKPNTEIRMKEQNTFINMIREKGQEVIQQWNLQISNKPLLINEKILEPGHLILGKQKSLAISDPKCNLDRDTQDTPLQTNKVDIWCIIGEQREKDVIGPFLDQLTRSNADMNYQFQKPLVVWIEDGRKSFQWTDAIKNCVEQAGNKHIQLILLILNGKKKDGLHYKELKQITIKQYGIPTQVILIPTIRSSQGGKLRTIANKLLVQMCAKIGGIPWGIDQLPFTNKPCMIVGIDLFTDKKKNSSVMGFCATWDKNLCKYYSEAVVNGDKNDFCKQIKPCLTKAIQTFAKKNGNFCPQTIIFIREGQSTGNMDQIKAIEISQVRETLESIPNCKTTKIVYMCVNKTVNAKFYKSSQDMGRMDSPSQGSLIEDQVTFTQQDFYIISQRLGPGQGIPSPTHYLVVENDLGQEVLRDLEILCYKLCFLFYNWTGAIRTPAPLRYASTLSNLSGGQYDPRNPSEFLKPQNQVQDFIQDKIYYI